MRVVTMAVPPASTGSGSAQVTFIAITALKSCTPIHSAPKHWITAHTTTTNDPLPPYPHPRTK